MNVKSNILFLSALLFAAGSLRGEEPIVYEEDYSRFELEKAYPRLNGGIVRQKEDFRYLSLSSGECEILPRQGFCSDGSFDRLHIRTKICFPKFEPQYIPGGNPTFQSVTFNMRRGDGACSFTLRPMMTIFTFNPPEAMTPEAKEKRLQEIKEGKRREGESFNVKQRNLLSSKLEHGKWYELDIRIEGPRILVVLTESGRSVTLLKKENLVPGTGGISLSATEAVEIGPVLVTLPAPDHS